jgi:hypothetical protein
MCARRFKATNLVVEEMVDGFFGETLEGYLSDIDYPMAVEKVTAGIAKKGQRIIEAIGPPMGAGRLIILEGVARSDHGGEFTNQMVRVSYDGRTGSKKTDHDDIVDALAHAVAKVKGSLISDTADNIATFEAEKLEQYAGWSLRQGGLGDAEQQIREVGRADTPRGLDGDMSFVERLMQEDGVLLSFSERHDKLLAVVQTDLANGRTPEKRMTAKIRELADAIKTMKEVQIL